jgi:flavodoxin
MEKLLITYFSASGTTKKVAEKIQSLIGGDLFEIEPVNIYTEEDLNWTDKNSRSSLEMADKSSRPPIKNKVENIDAYDNIAIGFPIWWYTAPTIINTFIEENNLQGKRIYIFATSGGSNAAKSFEDLKSTYPQLNFISEVRLNENVSNEELDNWLI